MLPVVMAELNHEQPSWQQTAVTACNCNIEFTECSYETNQTSRIDTQHFHPSGLRLVSRARSG